MKNLVLVVMLVFTALSLQAQSNGSISGTIVDRDGNPLSNANVYLQNTNYGTSSNKNGFYNLSNIQSGNYMLIVSDIGYKTFTSENIEINGEITLNIELQNDVSSLDDVVISGAGKSEYTEKTHPLHLNYNKI